MVVIMVWGLVVALGASAVFLLLSGPGHGLGQGPEDKGTGDSGTEQGGTAQPDQAPGPAPAAVGAPGGLAAGEPSVHGELTGTTTLSDPEITTVKAPFDTPSQWCGLLTSADVLAVTGFDQRGAPETEMMCTHYFGDDAGYLMISDIPAEEGRPYLVRGNSAIMFQRDPAACEVSVALNHGGGVLDIDIRGVVSPRIALCDVATLLATRAFDRLPDA
ncbi:MAG: hypothetical protein ACRDTF_22190 [Pseudonocardiaceae bacterium]